MKDNKRVPGLFNAILGLAFSIGIFMAFSMIIGAGLLNILGFQYTSISVVVMFLFTYTLMAFIIEPMVESYVLAVIQLGRFNKIISNVIGFIFCVGADIVILSFLESIINGIRIPDKTIILYSVITYTSGKIFEALAYKNDTEEAEMDKDKEVKVNIKVEKKNRKAEKQRKKSREENN